MRKGQTTGINNCEGSKTLQWKQSPKPEEWNPGNTHVPRPDQVQPTRISVFLFLFGEKKSGLDFLSCSGFLKANWQEARAPYGQGTVVTINFLWHSRREVRTGQGRHFSPEMYSPPLWGQSPSSSFPWCHVVQETILAHLAFCNSLADLLASLFVLHFQ